MVLSLDQWPVLHLRLYGAALAQQVNFLYWMAVEQKINRELPGVELESIIGLFGYGWVIQND